MSNRLALQRRAQDVLVAERIRVEPTDPAPPPRFGLQQSLPGQLPQGLTHRSHAHPQLRGQWSQRQPLSRSQPPLHDPLAQPPSRLLGQGLFSLDERPRHGRPPVFLQCANIRRTLAPWREGVIIPSGFLPGVRGRSLIGGTSMSHGIGRGAAVIVFVGLFALGWCARRGVADQRRAGQGEGTSEGGAGRRRSVPDGGPPDTVPTTRKGPRT